MAARGNRQVDLKSPAPVDRRWHRLSGCDWSVPLLLLWMFLACCFPLFDTDLFWHLKTGEWILQNGSIPGYDLYTFTDYDKRWIDLHWGFQVMAAILYRIGGANLLILAKCTILALAIGVGCYAGGAELRGWQRALCWLLPAITISGRGYERPEIVTVLCLATWLAILARLETRPKWIWYLPLLQVFWINCHALFILGLVVGACYAIDHMVRHWLGGHWGLKKPSDQVAGATLIRVGGLCGLAAFVNPYMEQGAFFPLVLFRKFTVEQQFYAANIGEFQRPVDFLSKHGFVNLYLNAELLLWLAVTFSFVMLAIRGRFSLFRVLIFAAFSYLAWKASRNTNIFSIVAGFVLMENLGEILPRAPIKDGGSAAESRPTVWGHRGLQVLLVGMIVAVVTGEWNRRTEQVRPFRLGEANAWFAHDAARFMGQPGFPQRVFAANFGIASVYTYHNGPEGKVFMDGRLEVCTQATFQQFNLICHGMSTANPIWAELLRDKEGNLPAVMLDTRYSRQMIQGVGATPGWRLVYADQACAVFFSDRVAQSLKLPTASFEPLLKPPKW
ncbi:MAG: hypothetical protein JSS49_27760 [Planctomycetes bacterium]|nr:hypothetical protein [Planctomycetota bacterium]